MPAAKAKTSVALIRGVNVGGHRSLPMARLREALESIGCRSVRTYLQSGNAVFEPSKGAGAGLVKRIREALSSVCGVDVPVTVLGSGDLRRMIASNPFLGRPGISPEHLHVSFIQDRRASLGLKTAPIVGLPGEEAVVAEGCVYLYCPHGYGGSKLTNALLERRIGSPVTTRNWRTVTELARMAEEPHSP